MLPSSEPLEPLPSLLVTEESSDSPFSGGSSERVRFEVGSEGLGDPVKVEASDTLNDEDPPCGLGAEGLDGWS